MGNKNLGEGALKGRLSAKNFIEDYPDGIKVRCRAGLAVGFRVNPFGRHIGRGTWASCSQCSNLGKRIINTVLGSNTEIHEFGYISTARARCDHDVCRFDVAVEDAVLVDMGKSV